MARFTGAAGAFPLPGGQRDLVEPYVVIRLVLVSVHLESGDDVVILEGLAEDVTTDEVLGRRIIAAWMAKYGRLAPDPAGSGMCRLRPQVARGWSASSLKDGARWRFG